MCVPSKARGKCGSFVLSRDDSPSEQEVRTMDAGINSELCEDSSKFENLIKPDVESKWKYFSSVLFKTDAQCIVLSL